MSSFWISSAIGVPSVAPSKTPLRIRTVSDSFRWLVRRLWPGRRRSRSGWMSASDKGRRGGQPSTTAPMAPPWDSPQVVTRKSVPKVFPMAGSRIPHSCTMIPVPPRATPPTLLLLVRHGLTPTTGKVLPGQAPGLPLSAAGRRQAEAAAARLGRLERLSAVYASPLERARETAAPIAGALKLRVRVDPAITECDVGEWTGGRLRRLRKRPEWRVVQHHPSGFRFPGGES